MAPFDATAISERGHAILQAVHRAEPAEAERLTWLLIERHPAEAIGWLRLAYIDSQTNRQLSSRGHGYILRSYELEPLGPEVTRWRLTFLFEHWTALGNDIRTRALRELEVAFPRHGWAMRDIPSNVTDPRGRMVAHLAFSRLRAAEAVRSADER